MEGIRVSCKHSCDPYLCSWTSNSEEMKMCCKKYFKSVTHVINEAKCLHYESLRMK